MAKWFLEKLQDIQDVDDLFNAHQWDSERNNQLYDFWSGTPQSTLGSCQYAEDLAYYWRWQEICKDFMGLVVAVCSN
jgi:hypothetical protein